ncbi:hypothetical protein GCM10027294_34320 [Marinactinospora endophytica]
MTENGGGPYRPEDGEPESPAPKSGSWFTPSGERHRTQAQYQDPYLTGSGAEGAPGTAASEAPGGDATPRPAEEPGWYPYGSSQAEDRARGREETATGGYPGLDGYPGTGGYPSLGYGTTRPGMAEPYPEALGGPSLAGPADPAEPAAPSRPEETTSTALLAFGEGVGNEAGGHQPQQTWEQTGERHPAPEGTPAGPDTSVDAHRSSPERPVWENTGNGPFDTAWGRDEVSTERHPRAGEDRGNDRWESDADPATATAFSGRDGDTTGELPFWRDGDVPSRWTEDGGPATPASPLDAREEGAARLPQDGGAQPGGDVAWDSYVGGSDRRGEDPLSTGLIYLDRDRVDEGPGRRGDVASGPEGFGDGGYGPADAPASPGPGDDRPLDGPERHDDDPLSTGLIYLDGSHERETPRPDVPGRGADHGAAGAHAAQRGPSIGDAPSQQADVPFWDEPSGRRAGAGPEESDERIAGHTGTAPTAGYGDEAPASPDVPTAGYEPSSSGAPAGEPAMGSGDTWAFSRDDPRLPESVRRIGAEAQDRRRRDDPLGYADEAAGPEEGYGDAPGGYGGDSVSDPLTAIAEQQARARAWEEERDHGPRVFDGEDGTREFPALGALGGRHEDGAPSVGVPGPHGAPEMGPDTDRPGDRWAGDELGVDGRRGSDEPGYDYGRGPGDRWAGDELGVDGRRGSDEPGYDYGRGPGDRWAGDELGVDGRRGSDEPGYDYGREDYDRAGGPDLRSDEGDDDGYGYGYDDRGEEYGRGDRGRGAVDEDRYVEDERYGQRGYDDRDEEYGRDDRGRGAVDEDRYVEDERYDDDDYGSDRAASRRAPRGRRRDKLAEEFPGFDDRPLGASPGDGYPGYDNLDTLPETEPKASAALWLGIASLIPVIGLFTAVGVFVVGPKARRDIRESRGELEGLGLVKAGTVLAVVGAVLTVVEVVLYLVL